MKAEHGLPYLLFGRLSMIPFSTNYIQKHLLSMWIAFLGWFFINFRPLPKSSHLNSIQVTESYVHAIYITSMKWVAIDLLLGTKCSFVLMNIRSTSSFYYLHQLRILSKIRVNSIVMLTRCCKAYKEVKCKLLRTNLHEANKIHMVGKCTLIRTSTA